MTDTASAAPSADEILTLWHRQPIQVNQSADAFVVAFAREALAKWGTPPAVAGEPVAWRYRPSAVWDDYVLTDDPGKAARARGNGLHVEALCLTTPQPTQAQAGAVPPIECNTEELKRAYAFGWWSALEKQREALHAGAVPLTDEQIAEGFAKRSRHIGLFAGGVRFAERHHGIKGGQHGAE